MAIFESDHARSNTSEVNRADDRPVVSFCVDLDQVNIRQSADAERTFDRMTRHRLGDDITVRNAMLAQVMPVERCRHRRVAPVAIEIARPFTLCNGRLEQRHLSLVAVCLLQPSESGRLRLDHHSAQVVRGDQLAKVVFAHAVECADLQERHLRISDQLIRDDIPQAATNSQRRVTNNDRRRKATLISEPAKYDISPPPARVGPQPLRRYPMAPFTEAPRWLSLHSYLGATGSASAFFRAGETVVHAFNPIAPGSAGGCHERRNLATIQLARIPPRLQLPQIRLLQPREIRNERAYLQSCQPVQKAQSQHVALNKPHGKTKQ